MIAFEERKELKDVLLENEAVTGCLKPEEISSLLDPISISALQSSRWKGSTIN